MFLRPSDAALNWTIDYVNEKLKSLKQFCERHVNIYVNETIKPKEKVFKTTCKR